MLTQHCQHQGKAAPALSLQVLPLSSSHQHSVPSPLPVAGAGLYSLPNVSGEALQGHIIQGQVAQAPELGEALRKPVRT